MILGSLKVYSIEFRWENFKPFVDTDWIIIKPITILIGPNNSGKSSLLAPLLILKQTLRSTRSGSPLVLRDELINAGSFSDIVYSHDLRRRITFHIRFMPRPVTDDLPDLGDEPPTQCSVTFRSVGTEGEFALHEYRVSDAYNRVMLSRIRTGRGSRIQYTLDGITNWASGDENEEDVTESRTNQAAEKAIREAMPFHFLFSSRNVVRAAIRSITTGETIDESSDHAEESWTGESDSTLRLSSFIAKYLSTVDLVDHYVREHALDFVFLGPLREDPRRLYEMSGDAPRDVGVRGQFGPELLYRNQRRPVFSRVDRWLKEFGVTGSLVCNQVTQTAFNLQIESENSKTNFADVGFGFSQLLPLIVQGLTAPAHSLLIAEQPEIHLNPRLQAKLASLFLEVTKRKAAVLIETHSEHLILAIRRLIAEGSLESDDVAIYFVEGDEHGSHVRSVPLQENGHIDPSLWPKGFFEDSLRESLALASAQAARRARAQ
jgi:predicted ATPase